VEHVSSADPHEILRAVGVVPVIALPGTNAVLPLCEALLQADLPIVEITFRTSHAADAIATIAHHLPEMCVGAGTVTALQEVSQAKDAGARFAVAPGLNPQVLQRATELELPFWPGVCTPSEIDQALNLNQHLLKYFPAGALGGPSTLAAILAPFLHLEVQVIPTGGINEETAPGYWNQPGVAAVGGSWIAPRDLIEDGDWPEITRRAQRAVDLWRTITPHRP
jgi:2-dehydro-3-deoxyphosphogluconate aldolase/(4S)-4-hydroxy-2-oxoglutarate aldolase